jgi:hypothetical protein
VGIEMPIHANDWIFGGTVEWGEITLISQLTLRTIDDEWAVQKVASGG